MATLAEALAGVSNLEPFEGRDVLSVGIELPNAGGGLREAMAIEPVEIHHGEEGYLVIHWRCRKVRFDEVKDTDGLRRVQVLDAVEAAIVDGAAVEATMADQRERIRKAKEEAAGIQRLAYEGTDELMLEHEKGDHADERMDGCPLCEEERAAEEAGD